MIWGIIKTRLNLLPLERKPKNQFDDSKSWAIMRATSFPIVIKCVQTAVSVDGTIASSIIKSRAGKEEENLQAEITVFYFNFIIILIINRFNSLIHFHFLKI